MNDLRERITHQVELHLEDWKQHGCRNRKMAAEGILALVDAEYRPGWVGVKERLPVVEKTADGSVNCILIYAKGRFECGSDIQVWNALWCRLNPETYTHWRPLPEPPKEEL